MYEKKLINKKISKLIAKKCFFCDIDDYALLDVHRIIPGEKGGTYTEANTVVCCANCHRKIHNGKIVIDRKYPSTGGVVLHYWEGKEEKWV